jgi:hypothetical protein
VVGLLALVVGVGSGYLLFYSEPDQEVPAEVEQFLDEWLAAWGTGDMDAILETMTDNAKYDGWRVDEAGAGGFVGRVTPLIKEAHRYWTIDVMVTDTPSATHPGAPYTVAHEYAQGFDGMEGIAHDETLMEMLYLVEVDGELKLFDGEHVG